MTHCSATVPSSFTSDDVPFTL
ncbi:hypothetical protein PQZ66_gp42 [Klebsiella phage vB_KleM_KB2]|nr:hypothetical protein PQZ66_gp42 [Klebsiella phage vB_KleM_KB2]